MEEVKKVEIEESNACKYQIDLDKEGNPIIVADNPECQDAMMKALNTHDVTVKVKAKAEKPKTS